MKPVHYNEGYARRPFWAWLWVEGYAWVGVGLLGVGLLVAAVAAQ